ncbi:MAG: hypothetical protein IKY94_11645 [Lachnospiraceae bacterium]|nr:hypothetical protein [Lachnospiraceae bacterium]
MEYRELFKDFLIEFGYKCQFDRNCKGYSNFRLYSEGESPEDYVICVFLLEHTLEGFDFWWDVHCKWNDYLRNTGYGYKNSD